MRFPNPVQSPLLTRSTVRRVPNFGWIFCGADNPGWARERAGRLEREEEGKKKIKDEEEERKKSLTNLSNDAERQGRADRDAGARATRHQHRCKIPAQTADSLHMNTRNRRISASTRQRRTARENALAVSAFQLFQPVLVRCHRVQLSPVRFLVRRNQNAHPPIPARSSVAKFKAFSHTHRCGIHLLIRRSGNRVQKILQNYFIRPGSVSKTL